MKKIFLLGAILAATATYGQNSRLIDAKPLPQRAKAMIFIYLDGGSSHLDTFDPKPEAGRDYTGRYREPIRTNVEGIIVGEKLAKLAKIADKYAIIRSMTHGNNAHESSHYIMQTGDLSGEAIVYPSYCSMISYLKEEDYKGSLFPYITLVESSTRFNEAGFLPPMYKTFDTGGRPDERNFNVEGIINKSIPDKELEMKRTLLEIVRSDRIEQNTDVSRLHAFQDKAYEVILGEERNVFDLSTVSDTLRRRYGMTRFGQSCLVARRLVERGVPIVQIRYMGWDTHKEHFARMDERLEDLDSGLSSLLIDLDREGLLKSTIVICGGEFGRTPKIANEPPWNGGRGHFGAAFSYLVAGGGIEGGIIIGKSDEKGETVVERPVYPADFVGTIYTLWGIDPTAKINHPLYGPIPLLPQPKDAGNSTGIITELIKTH